MRIVRFIHSIALSGVPEPARSDIAQEWEAHDFELASDGAGGARRVGAAAMACVSHTLASITGDPLHVPTPLMTISQIGALVVLCWLVVTAELAAWFETFPLLLLGSAVAVVVLNAPLRKRQALLMVTNALGVLALVRLVVAIGIHPVSSAMVSAGLLLLGLASALSIYEWHLPPERRAPNAFGTSLAVTFATALVLVVMGLVFSGHGGDWSVTVGCALVAVGGAFGMAHLLRLRSQYGTVFGPPAHMLMPRQS